MDIVYVTLSMMICIYMIILFLKMSDKFLPGCHKYYLTPAWIFRKDLLNREGLILRWKINTALLVFIGMSTLYFLILR